MSEYLAIMICPNGHEWGRVGHDNGEGGVSLGRCTPGSADDPSICSECGQAAKHISLMASPKRRREPRADVSRHNQQRREREKLAAWNANAKR